MEFKLLIFLLFAGGLGACGQGMQQALAPDPRLMPTASSTPTASVVVVPENTPSVTVSPASPSPVATPLVATAAITDDRVADLAKLQVFTATEARLPANGVVTRRSYARWLFAAHNAIYQAGANQQIKLAPVGDPAVFTDVPASSPDFAIIQGLAAAGIIPSSLNGNNAMTTFGGDLPLTREQLILWKVPLDSRQALAPATLTQVQQAWGFQDASKISPHVLGAVLADFKNGDRSNIRRAFGYTTLLQPQKPVTFAEVVATIWYFGAGEGQTARSVLNVVDSSPSP